MFSTRPVRLNPQAAGANDRADLHAGHAILLQHLGEPAVCRPEGTAGGHLAVGESASGVGVGVELDFELDQSAAILSLSSASRTFALMSCSVSFSICFVLSLLCSISFLSCYGFAGLRLRKL